MTASVLAKLKDAPILLNPTDKLDNRVSEEIKKTRCRRGNYSGWS